MECVHNADAARGCLGPVAFIFGAGLHGPGRGRGVSHDAGEAMPYGCRAGGRGVSFTTMAGLFSCLAAGALAMASQLSHALCALTPPGNHQGLGSTRTPVQEPEPDVQRCVGRVVRGHMCARVFSWPLRCVTPPKTVTTSAQQHTTNRALPSGSLITMQGTRSAAFCRCSGPRLSLRRQVRAWAASLG